MMKIQIPKPCSEDIQKMTPVERGLFCGACQKTVIDFSSMSDAAIIEYFKKAGKEKTCGIFNKTQVDRTLLPQRVNTKTQKYKLFLKELAAASVAFFLTSTSAKSQTDTTKTEYHQKIEIDAIEGIAPPFTITGKIANGEESISDALISVKGTNYKTSSLQDGNFLLLISKGSLQQRDSITLVAEYEGFKTKEITISPKTKQSILIDFDEKEEKQEFIASKTVEVSSLLPTEWKATFELEPIVFGNFTSYDPFPKKTIWKYVNGLFVPIKEEHPVNIKEQDTHQPKKSTLMPHVSQWYTRIRLYQNVKDFVRNIFS